MEPSQSPFPTYKQTFEEEVGSLRSVRSISIKQAQLGIEQEESPGDVFNLDIMNQITSSICNKPIIKLEEPLTRPLIHSGSSDVP